MWHPAFQSTKVIKVKIRLKRTNCKSLPAASYPGNHAGGEVGKTNPRTPDQTKLQKVGLPTIRWSLMLGNGWKQNWTFFSFVVNILDFNLVLGLEANSSADPESKLVFQVVVLECKVPAYWFDITLITTTNASRTFLTQTVVGLASSAPHQIPMWGLPLPPVAPSRMQAQPPFGNRTTRSFTRASTFRWISTKPMSGS